MDWLLNDAEIEEAMAFAVAKRSFDRSIVEVMRAHLDLVIYGAGMVRWIDGEAIRVDPAAIYNQRSLMCISCGALTDAAGQLPCGH